jgi:type VI secretion system protein ImpM
LETGLTQGFFGKIPARGDFVRAGLPRAFIEPWDRWLELVLAGSRESLGDAWRAAWLEAAVWRFALASGIAGPTAAYGVLLPSVDAHGRYFPLTVARLGEAAIDPQFLAAAETAGCAAVADDLAPDELAARLLVPGVATSANASTPTIPEHGTLWWTDGAPRRSPLTLALAGLPDAATFSAMLDQSAPG